jgi:hypothetical protein
LGGVALIATVGVGSGSLWLQTAAGNRFLTRQLRDGVRGAMTEGDFTLGRLETDLWGHAVAYDVVLTDGEGRRLIAASRVAVGYDLAPLLSKRVYIDEIRLDGGVADLVADEQGLLDLQRVFGQAVPKPESDEPWAGLPVDVVATRFVVSGVDVRYRTPQSDLHLVGVHASGAATAHGARIAVTDLSLGAYEAAPHPVPFFAHAALLAYTGDGVDVQGLELVAPETRLRVDGTVSDLSAGGVFALDVTADPVDLRWVDPFVGAGLSGTWRGELAVTGTGRDLRVDGRLDGVGGTRGGLEAHFQMDPRDPQMPWRADLRPEGFHIEDLFPRAATELVLDGALVGSGQGRTWPEDIRIEAHFLGEHQKVREIELTHFETTLLLERGVLSFRETDVRGPLGELIGEGTLDLVGGDLVVDTSGLLRLMGLEAFDVGLLGGDGGVRVRLTGNLFAEDRPLEARGTASFAPFVYGSDVRFDRLDAAFSWRRRGEEMHVQADATGSGGVAYGVAVARVTAPGIQVRLPESGDVFVTGHAVAEEVRAPGDVQVSTVDVAYTVELARQGDLTLAADAVLGPQVIQGFPGARGVGQVTLDGDDVAFDVDLFADADRTFVVATGTYDLAAAAVVLEDLVVAPTPRQVWSGVGTQRFRIVDGGVADAEISLASNLGRFELQGTLGTVEDLDAKVAIDALDLDALAELYPERFSGLDGQVALDLALVGRPADPEVQGTVDVDGLWVEGYSRWLDVQGRVDAGHGRAQVDLVLDAAGEPLATVVGTFPLVLDLADPHLDPDGRVDATLTLRPGDLRRFEWLREGLGLPRGRISATLQASGRLGDPSFHASGVAEMDVKGWSERGRLEFDLVQADGKLSFWADAREGFSTRGEISGTGTSRVDEVLAWAVSHGPEPDFEDWTLYIDDLKTKVALLGTPVESLLLAAGIDVASRGELLGGFVIQGSPMRPQIVGGVTWTDASLGNVELTGAYLGLTPLAPGYELDFSMEFADGGNLSVHGPVPIDVDLREDADTWGRGDLDLFISGDGIPLQVLTALDPDIAEADGLVVVDGTIRGSVFDPAPDFRLALEDGRVVHRVLGLEYRDIDIAVTGDSDRLQLTRMSVTTRDPEFSIQKLVPGTREMGRVQARGSAILDEGWQPTGLTLVVNLDQAHLIGTEDKNLRVSGKIDASGEWPALDVHGDLSVDHATFVLDKAAFATASAFETTPLLLIHRGDAAEEVVRKESSNQPSVYRDFAVDVDVALNRNVEIEAELPFVDELGGLGASLSTLFVKARLGSDQTGDEGLNIRMKGGELAVFHEVDVLEGQAKVLRSLFDVTGGSVTFLGDPTEPLLDVSAEMVVSGGAIDLSIQGTPSKPDIAFSSKEYADQTEIFSILLTGRSPEELSNTEGQSAISALSGLLLSSALGSASGTAGVTIDPDGTVRVDFPLRSNLYGSIKVNPAPIEQENAYTLEIEYTPFRHIVLEVDVGDEHSWSDIFWEVRF